MTNAPDTRKTHVVRLVGTNKNGDILQDIWLDIERMDIIKSKTQTVDGFRQGHQKKLQWMDDPTADDYNADGNPARDLQILKVCSPDEDDVTDPEQWVAVQVIRSLRSRQSDNGVMDRHRNSVPGSDDEGETNDARVVEPRRISNYATNIDADAEAAFAADPTLTAYVVDGSNYQRDDSTKDDSNYVEHEVITYLKHRRNENDGSVSNQGRQTQLLNQYLIDESDLATLKITGANGLNPPYRLDPYQNIINVNWGGGPDVIVVFCNQTTSSPDTYSPLSDKVQFLGNFPVQFTQDGVFSLICSAFLVNSGQGEFIIDDVGLLLLTQTTVTCYVFAIIKDDTGQTDIGASLARAQAGSQLAVAAYFNESHGSSIPFQPDPPGMLWSVAVILWSGGPITWKIGYNKHRQDGSSTLPNKMVQCYPMILAPYVIPPGGEVNTVRGYQIATYRLDKAGTGQSYGTDYNYLNEDNSFEGNHMPGPWFQAIAGGPAGPAGANGVIPGIPFGDPPPLIDIDIPSS